MNILLTNSTTIFAGGEDYVLILAKYLQQRGHTVHVSALPGHLLLEKCAAARIPTLPIRYSGMGNVFGVAAELRKQIRTHAIDIIHSNANYDRTCAALAAAGSRARHVASVHSAHSIQYNLTHYLRNHFGTSQFIADAEAVRSVLIANDGLPSDRVSVIPIGVEEADRSLSAAARKEFRAEINARPSTIVIGNVARLVPFKGHRYLLQAVAGVVRTHPDVFFPIIGDGELFASLTDQARALGIERYVGFLGFRDNLETIYPGFDIYCHSSLELAAEAFPLAILRALSTGLPVVSTRVGGISSMVQENISGFLTAPEDPAAFAAALSRLIRDETLRNSMGKKSYELFREKFHAAAMAESVEGIYRQVLDRDEDGD